MIKKLSLQMEDIAVLTSEDISQVSGGEGTLGCSKPCKPGPDTVTIDSSNCVTTTGNDGGCRPTSKGCYYMDPF